MGVPTDPPVGPDIEAEVEATLNEAVRLCKVSEAALREYLRPVLVEYYTKRR